MDKKNDSAYLGILLDPLNQSSLYCAVLTSPALYPSWLCKPSRISMDALSAFLSSAPSMFPTSLCRFERAMRPVPECMIDDTVSTMN